MPARLQEPWRPHLPRHDVDSCLRSWLTDDGSLTTRLQKQGRFSLRLLQQGARIPHRDEAGIFGLRAKCLVFTREVLLYVDDAPQIFAHTILPLTSRGTLSVQLTRLGGRALGSLLFSHPGFRRHPFRFRSLDQRHPLHQRAAPALQLPRGVHLHARRSVFTGHRQAMLVTEIFSPGLSTL